MLAYQDSAGVPGKGACAGGGGGQLACRNHEETAGRPACSHALGSTIQRASTQPTALVPGPVILCSLLLGEVTLVGI